MTGLVPVDVAKHGSLFKEMYSSGSEFTESSQLSSSTDYEAALTDPCTLWRIYVVDDKAIGLAGLHRINMVDRCSGISVAILPGVRHQGHGLNLMRSIVRFGFDSLNLHRIHTLVLRDSPAFNLGPKIGFKHEGTMKGARYRNGGYEDLHAYTMFREEYEQWPGYQKQ